MTRADLVLGALAILALAGFVGVLVWKVPSPALIAVCLLGLALAVFDFARTAVRRRSADRDAEVVRPASAMDEER